MINRIKKLFQMQSGKAAGGAKIDMRLAAAVLLVEASRADHNWEAREMSAMRRLLSARFDLNQTEVEALLTAAVTVHEGANDIYRFTRALHQAFDHAQRIELIEMLWEVVYADATLDAYEDGLIRHIGGLLYIEDKERGEARQRVRARLGLAAG